MNSLRDMFKVIVLWVIRTFSGIDSPKAWVGGGSALDNSSVAAVCVPLVTVKYEIHSHYLTVIESKFRRLTAGRSRTVYFARFYDL